nr:unnamed protein product [Spirometra erinaceieuropaei]
MRMQPCTPISSIVQRIDAATISQFTQCGRRRLVSGSSYIVQWTLLTQYKKWKCSINFDAFGRTAECQTYMSSSPNKYNVFCNATFPQISLVVSHNDVYNFVVIEYANFAS